MKKLYVWISAVFVGLSTVATAQTNPGAYNLSEGSFTFTGFTDPESTVYPAHTQGWSFEIEPDLFYFDPAILDRALVGQSIPIWQGNIRNEGTEGISFRNSSSNNIGALALALNTTGRENMTVTYTVEDMVADNTRQNGIVLQYRVGTTGDFTNIEGTTYLSNPTGQAPAETFVNIALPEALNDQANVQLRWLYFYQEGGGARDRIRLDDITVSSDEMAVEGVQLTFRVDMSQFVGTIDPAGMHIAGSFPTNTWDPPARQMTNDGNGVWSWTETLEPGSTLEYKFVRGPGWQFGDENMGGQPCGAPGTTNRTMVVPAENTVLPAVCYGSCNPCNIQAPTSAITFQVDMSLETIAPEGVNISGSFNNFELQAMNNAGNGLYTITLDLVQGASVTYKFRNGTEFESPEGDCSDGPFNDRFYTVPEADATLDVVCYSSCEACADPVVPFLLTFILDASEIVLTPEGVYIAGNFNDFNPVAMTNDGAGLFTFTAEIEEGTLVEWKYYNGASTGGAEVVPAACGIDDGASGFNRFFEMPDSDTTLDVVCFNSCIACPSSTNNLTNSGALQLYPNPNDGNFNMVAPASGLAVTRVFDISGRVVHHQVTTMSAGEVVQQNGWSLDAGYYLIDIRIGDNTYGTRMVIK